MGLSPDAALTAVVGLVASACSAPLVRRAAVRWHFVDQPDGRRKFQREAIPLGGGLAVLLGSGAALVYAGFRTGRWPDVGSAEGAWGRLGLLSATAVIVGIGLLDDRCTLRGRHKLAGQILAVCLLLCAGFVVREVRAGGALITLGLLSVPATALWLISCINGINLIDGHDGLATTVGTVMAVTLAGIAAVNHHSDLVVPCLALAAGLLGFLPMNLPPARQYLGDAGSTSVGLVLGVLTVEVARRGATTAVTMAPFVVWTIPALDTLAAVARRRLTGRSIYASDRGHLHHCLAARGHGPLWTVGVALLLSAAASLSALAGAAWANDAAALAGGVGVGVFLAATGLFGRLELALSVRWLKDFVDSLRHVRPGGTPAVWQKGGSVEGEPPWDRYWEAFVGGIDPRCVQSVSVDAYPSSLNPFQGRWEHPRHCEADHLWRAEVPLHFGERLLGRLSIAGPLSEGSAAESLERLRHCLDHVQAVWCESLLDHQALTVPRSEGPTAAASAGNEGGWPPEGDRPRLQEQLTVRHAVHREPQHDAAPSIY